MNCQKLPAEQTLPGRAGDTDLPSPLLGHSAPSKLGKKPRQNSSLRPSASVVHPLGMFGSVRCFKEIWKVGKVGKVGEVGKVGRKGLFMPTWSQL
jgi:hypothetical protein